MTANLLPILTYPNEQLRTVAEEVVMFDNDLKQLAVDMIHTMQVNNGIGLAATQCGINKRIIVVVYNGSPLVMVNPKITQQEGEFTFEEGCLSVPGYFEDITRSRVICVLYQDVNGTKNELSTYDISAVCIQHEIQHLNGILFIDHLSKLKQQRALQKVKKTIRERNFALEGKLNRV